MKKVLINVGLFVAVVASVGCSSPTDDNPCGLNVFDYESSCENNRRDRTPTWFVMVVHGSVWENGIPVQGVRVTLWQKGVWVGGQVEKSTDAGGYYSLSNSGRGGGRCTDLVVRFLHPDGRSATVAVPNRCQVHYIHYYFK